MIIRNKFGIRSKYELPSLTLYIYCLAIGLYLVSFILSTTLLNFPPFAFTMMFIMSGALLIVYESTYIISDRYKIENYLGFLIAFIFFLLCWHIADLKIAVTFFIIFSSRKIDFRMIGRECAIITAVLLMCVIIFSKVGVVMDYVSNGEGRVRHYLGFRYCLYPSTYLFNVTALCVYLKKHSIKYIELIVLLVSNYWMYLQTVSRLTFYSAVALLFLSLLIKIKPLKKRRRYAIFFPICFSFIFFFVFSYFICWNYSMYNPFLKALNNVLGGRLQYANTSLHKFGIGLFGSDVQWNGWGLSNSGKLEADASTYLYVDNFYINIIQKYGIAFSFSFISLLTIMLCIAYKKKDYYLIIIMLFIGMHGLIDDAILYLPYNTFWVMISIYIYNNENAGLRATSIDVYKKFLRLTTQNKRTVNR